MFATKVTQQNTRVRVVVHRHDAGPIAFDAVAENGALRSPGAVVGLSSQKALGAIGGFTVTVKCPRSFNVLQEIQPGDWAVWWWEINGRAYHGTFGPILNVGRSRVSKDGADVVEYPIVCADFTRVMAQTQVWFDDFSEYETNIGGVRLGAAMGFTPTGSPDAVIENVLHAFLGQSGLIGGAWKLPSSMSWIGQHFVEGLFISASSTKAIAEPRIVGAAQPFVTTANGFAVLSSAASVLRGEVNGPEISLFQPATGTILMQHIASLSNDLLNEVIYDVLTEDDTILETTIAPDQPSPCIFVRERPFPNAIDQLHSPWFRLPTVKLDRNEGLFTDNTTMSDEERVNLVLLYGTAMGTGALDQYALSPPSYDREDIARHGICKFERQTPFVGFGAMQDGTPWTIELSTWHDLVSSWYGLNHRWLAGPLSFARALPKARVGRRIVIDDANERDRLQFYIESVTHQWAYPSGGQTTLGVTRGWRGTDEALVSAVTAKSAVFQREARGGQGTAKVRDPAVRLFDREDPA